LAGLEDNHDSERDGALSTKSGLLLEHFARLAANVAGTSAAVVGVLGRRSDRNPKLAAFGLSQEQLHAVVELERLIGEDSGLTIVPDLAQDMRFAVAASPLMQLDLRFAGHLKLLSAGGENVGFILVLDPAPRDALTEAQAASLGDIAGMIMADRRREQRHLHLMHVADRALRIDRMLRLVSEAASCASALTGLLEELCRFHSAAVGRIWQLIRRDEPVHELSRYDANTGDFDSAEPSSWIAALSATAAEAIRRNEPHAIRCPPIARCDGAGPSVGAGLSSHVCVPIWVQQQQRFGISLGFTVERSDLDAVMADIASLADTIRPALYRKVTEERIRFVAHHDHLTQLANRVMFQERLANALAQAQCDNRGFALLYLDLDGFKLVNDTRGHDIGDRLLVAVARRLRENLRESDTVARVGGDEFAIIESSGSQPAAATALAQRLISAISQPYELEGPRSLISVSVGVAVYPTDGQDPDTLLRNADIALYRAKEAGRNTFRLFDPAMHIRQQERFLLEQDLRDAIEEGQFSLAYQPVCDIGSLRVVGFEALLRWNHPKRGLIQPNEFVQVAESTGLIVPLGRWALETACVAAATWDPPVRVSVNLSPLQFRQADLPVQIAEILRRTGLPAERLDLEVTEGLLLDASDLVLRTTRSLQQQGIRITLDDFGTAYASLSYLRRFSFDGMKIDQSFVRGIADDASTLAIARTILSLGEQLNVVVVAEGVETERELNMLRKLGCRLVQGYLSGRPMTERQVHAVLRRQREEHWNSVYVRDQSDRPSAGRLEMTLSAADAAPYEQGEDGK
jgi:diguanylate cyclase (GGDEF)-like protein